MRAEQLQFKQLKEEDYPILHPYFLIKKSLCCENSMQYFAIWQEDYHVQYALSDKGALLLFTMNNQLVCSTPLCKEEDLLDQVKLLKDYFSNVLHKKFHMVNIEQSILDQLAVDKEKYTIMDKDAHDDYLYDYHQLSTLSGKKYQKKRNLVHQFLKRYKDHYEYRILTSKDSKDILNVENSWLNRKEDATDTIRIEKEGLIRILSNLDVLADTLVAGIYIDHKLEAFEIATYDVNTKMVVEHIEKANPKIKGLYTVMMYLVLNNNFSDAIYVNRQEDMGIESLRVAKSQLHPIMKVKKYILLER